MTSWKCGPTREILVEDLLGRPLRPDEQKGCPSRLYVEGSIPARPGVVVAGTRSPSTAGVGEARSLATWLAKHGITVISGLAAGIDAVSHEAAIRAGGPTMAVLGTPLDQQYPAVNAELRARINLVVSQFPRGMVVSRWNFPVRNRLVALISDMVVIVEAGQHSGTVHLAREANRLGRPLLVGRRLAAARPGWLDGLDFNILDDYDVFSGLTGPA